MFLFAPCQVGAEKTLKSEAHRLDSSLRSSFSRPGFVTFIMPDDYGLPEVAGFSERSVFARTASLSLGKIQAEDENEIAEAAWKSIEENRLFVNRIHVFQRDADTPGHRGFEPGLLTSTSPELSKLYGKHSETGFSSDTETPNPEGLKDTANRQNLPVAGIHRVLIERSSKPKFLGPNHFDPLHPALPGETVLDLVQVDPGRFFVGVHTLSEKMPIHSYYPGGVLPITPPENAVSRAWLKFEEGLRWSGFPIGKGARCLDIGASPGGGSQVLLDRGAEVLGVDPAEIDPVVLNHPKFTHIRGRFGQTKRKLYEKVRWVIADMNVAPTYTLDVLEELVGRKQPRLSGMLFTLKLFQWNLAEELPIYADRIRRWGFAEVRIKQLAFNRREVMVAVSHS